MKTFVLALIMAAESAGVGALGMVAMSRLHEDVHAVPALGFSASWMTVLFLMTLGRVVKPHQEEK